MCSGGLSILNVFSKSYNRVGQQCSAIAKECMDVVEAHINQLRVGEVMQWVAHAKRQDGPLFWQIPSPPNSLIDPKDVNYKVRIHFNHY